MSTEIKQLNVTELDFSEIKENIKSYFQRQDSEFKDWDFDGSGLSTLIDVLAYNTHYNAVNAHLAVNESFLDSAQVRANVVSRAKLLGYTPSSRSSAVGSVNLTFLGDSTVDITSVASLPKGSTFSGVADGVTYTFVTMESYNAPASVNGTTGAVEFKFNDVLVYEGKIKTRVYEVDANNPNQKFVVNDESIDTSLMDVKVYTSKNTNTPTFYSRFENFTNISANSIVYFLYENHRGYFQVEFGDNVLGRRLIANEIVEIEYLSTTGKDANNVQSFSYTGSNPTGASSLVSITTTSKSAGGAPRQSIASIKHRAPLSFISQNRAVSASDYNALISKEFTNLQSLSVWGGEYNDPPKYGRVMISAKPFDAPTLTRVEKDRLLAIINDKKILAIQPEIVDPELLYIYADVVFKYNTNLTRLSQGEIENKVIRSLESYSENVLETFDGIFRYSNFLNTIDETDTAIVSSNANMFVYKNIELVVGNSQTRQINYNLQLGESITQSTPILSSDSYFYNDQYIYIEDEPDTSTSRNLYTYDLVNNEKRRLTTSVGTFDSEKGIVTLRALPISSTQVIKLKAAPRSNDIVAIRNQILSFDPAQSNIGGEIDTIEIAGDNGKTSYTTFNKSYS